MIFLLELAKKLVQLEQLVHCLPVFKESSSIFFTFFHFFSYIVILKIINLWNLQALSYSHNTWFGNKFKCTTKVGTNYLTAWRFLDSPHCTTWNYCFLVLNSLTVSRGNEDWIKIKGWSMVLNILTRSIVLHMNGCQAKSSSRMPLVHCVRHILLYNF